MSPPSPDPPRQSRLIGSVLTPALKLWVRSQLDSVETLNLRVQAGDRQLLSGQVEQVQVQASQAVYRGIWLSQVDLEAASIRTNLGQVVRGKPLKLLASFPIVGQICLEAEHLNRSLRSPLLGNAVTQFLLTVLGDELGQERGVATNLTLQDPQIRLGEDQLTLVAQLLSDSGQLTPVAVRCSLQVVEGCRLQLVNPQWLPHPTARQGLPLTDLEGYTLDLGSQVELTALQFTPAALTCIGKLWVLPASEDLEVKDLDVK